MKENDPKQLLQIKYNNYLDFLIKVNISNNQIIDLPSKSISYKVFIGKGNNSAVVKNAFKQRYLLKFI